MSNEYVGIVITPDAIRDGLVKCILDDLFSAVNMQILWQKHWRISSLDTVISIYPQLIDELVFIQVAKTMMAGSCLIIVACGENICTELHKIKGKIKFNNNYTEVKITGLRLKYRTWSFCELDYLKDYDHVNRQMILDKIFEYRIHTTDNLKETAILCVLCMSSKDIENFKYIAPLLYHEIIGLKNETV